MLNWYRNFLCALRFLSSSEIGRDLRDARQLGMDTLYLGIPYNSRGYRTRDLVLATQNCL